MGMKPRTFASAGAASRSFCLLARASPDNVTTAIEFAPHRPGEQQESFVNADKARDLLGWTADVTLADGLAQSYRWFERQLSEAAV